jgi:hypothetical protein
MCEVPRFKEIVPSLVDRRPPSLSEGDFAGKHIPNPGPNVVMHSEVGPWGKRQFGGSQFELIVKLSQMAEDHLFEFDFRRDARVSTVSCADKECTALSSTTKSNSVNRIIVSPDLCNDTDASETA